MDRTGMAITGTTSSGRAASTSARPYRPGSPSSVFQTTLYPTLPTKEVMLTPEHPTPGVLQPRGPSTRRTRYHAPREVHHRLSAPSTSSHSLHPRRRSSPSCSAPKSVFGFRRNGCLASPETGVQFRRNTHHSLHEPEGRPSRLKHTQIDSDGIGGPPHKDPWSN